MESAIKSYFDTPGIEMNTKQVALFTCYVRLFNYQRPREMCKIGKTMCTWQRCVLSILRIVEILENECLVSLTK